MPVTTTVSGVQYSGIWTMPQVNAAIAAGTWPTQPLPTFGNLYAWGLNTLGQTGVGDTTNRSSPAQIGALTTWLSVAGGYEHSLAITTSGALWAWGGNQTYGALGLGNKIDYSSPKQVGALTTWLNIAGGYKFTLANKTDGTLWSWGFNGSGRLGLGNVTHYSSPKQIGALTTWATITCGAASSFAIKTDGTLWSWGINDVGQLGLNNITYYSSPVQVGALTAWLKVASSSSSSSTLAVKTDGTLWAWGINNFGQLGVGNTVNRSSPTQVGALTTWTTVACGNRHTLAAKTDGTLWSWGNNGQGQLGLNSAAAYYSSPVQVGTLTTWSIVGAIFNNSAAIKTNRTIWSFGQNSQGQLGLGNITGYSSPKQIGSLATWIKIAGGGKTWTSIAA